MAMTNERFEALVARLETFARHHPARYRRRVVLLAASGYLYLLALFALFLGLAGGLLYLGATSRNYAVALKASVGLLVFSFLMVRALWVRMLPPKGLLLERRGYAALFDSIEKARRRAQAPPVHRVLLTNEFNASVVQVPRLGILGWQRNHLCLGLPLMLVLSAGEFEAVLAHEFGHLSGAHGRFGAWIYRVRETWARLHQSVVRSRHWAAFLVTRFLNWYAPYFQAYSFVMARAQEREADAVAAAACGSRPLADALLKLAVAGSFLQEIFWPRLLARAAELPQPPPAPLGALRESIAADLEPASASRWLERALSAPPSCADTHPSLAQRLAALGEAPRVPPTAEPSAAEALLGDHYPGLLQALGKTWGREIRPFWRAEHARMKKLSAGLVALEKKAQTGTLTAAEAFERAFGTEELHGREAALPLYDEILARDPASPAALFAGGRIRLAEGDPAGIGQIEKAMAINADYVLPGCEQIYLYLQAKGRAEEARPYYERGVARQQLLERAEQERARLEPGANYLPHALSSDDVLKIRAQLARYPDVRKAYLVRKEVKLLPEHPFHVLAVEKKLPIWKYYGADHARKTAQQLAAEVPVPGRAIIVVLGSGTGKLGRKVKRVKGAEIYRKT